MCAGTPIASNVHKHQMVCNDRTERRERGLVHEQVSCVADRHATCKGIEATVLIVVDFVDSGHQL